jgi:hypothetical protein
MVVETSRGDGGVVDGEGQGGVAAGLVGEDRIQGRWSMTSVYFSSSVARIWTGCSSSIEKHARTRNCSERHGPAW